MKWEELPLADRALLMAAAVKNGYTDIRSIKAAYANFQNQRQQTGNRYDEGGSVNTDEDTYHDSFYEWKNAISEHMGLDIDNDRTYDYMSFYYDNPAKAWAMVNGNPDAHFTDRFKTAEHPTFSTESDLSGKYDPINNPLVATGGTWTENPNTFTLPTDWYKGPSIPERISYLENAENNGVTMFMPDGSLPTLYNNEPWGGVLPELTVTNQKAYGGNLFAYAGKMSKKQKPTYRCGTIEQALVEGSDGTGWFKVTSASRKPGEAGNAGKDSAHTYSLKDGSPAALDIVPNGIGWDEFFTILNTPKMKAALTKYGFDLLNETSAAMKKKTGATGNHIHVGRGIKGQTGEGVFYGGNMFGGGYKHLPQEVNDMAQQVMSLQYNAPKAPVFTEEDQRLLDTPALAFYNPEYEDTQAPDYKPSALQESIKLDESLWRDPANNWALYNQFANMQQGSSQDDPLSWMTMMASLSPNTTPEQKEAASTMYQLFAPQDGDYSYHGLNFAAYGGDVNRFNDGGFSDLPEQRAYRRAVNLKAPYTNYEDAIDMDDSIMLRLKKFFDKGVSNCTLTASQLFNPNNPIGRARTIVNDSINNGFYEIDADHVIPGTMVIASHPNMSDYSPDQKYHTMIVTGFAPNDYEYTFRDGTKYQIKKGEPLVSYSRGKASADNYVHDIPLSVYNANSEGKTYNRYYRPIDENYPQVMLDNVEIVANKKGEGGNLFHKGGLEDQFANTYLGIGQFPDYDSDFIAANNLQYLPYSQLNMTGHDPENIRIGNHGNLTMYAYDDKDATYLADANRNLVTSPLLRQMTQDYVKEHYGPMLLKAFLSNPDKYWDEYNRYRNSAITFDENGNPVSSGLPPIEKPIEPAAPEFWLLSAGASKAPSALNSVISPLFNMTAVDNMIDDVTPYSSWGNMMSQNAGGPEWAWDLVHPSFTGGLFTNAAKKALTAGADAASKATRNAVASTAINYGAKTRTLPTNIYKSRMAFKGPDNKFVWDSDPFVEFINTKRDIPENTSFFFRMPKDANILNARNGAYRAKGSYYGPIISGGTVDGKFVSYGEPWMEFGTGPNSSWYEFPTSMNRGGRGPYRMATDWRGNMMDYDVTEAWRSMMLTQNPEFVAEEKAIDEALSSKKFNSTRERVQAYKEARTPFYEKWEYNPDIRTDIYAGNQTVIPNKEWHFDNRGFLSRPFWRYTADPYSGAVQKELMIKPPTFMQTMEGTHADILPFIDPETGGWDYLTDL